jgi:hypothetical protein
MQQKAETPPTPTSESGWIYVSLFALSFAILYLLNYLLPLFTGSYTTRIWSWTEWILAGGALLVIGFRWRSIHWATALTTAGLGITSGLSRGLHDHSLGGGLVEGTAVWLTFMAGTALFQGLKRGQVPAFQPPLAKIFRNLCLGLLAAVPLAAVNNLFFFLQNGAPKFQNVFASAGYALSPGIHEEAIYRYFILAVCFTFLQGSSRRRLAWIAAVVLAVIPHSLLHLPDLFLDNPWMGLGMLAATSLLFGLPMALLQVKRSFESAVAFHWFIDFARFLFGY